ncbi:MAG: site-specific DNA-methyltransferase [Planctomycetota bacterium]
MIFGDNLLVLKALERECASQVKCIYIDPPYNTGSAFEHYGDDLEHSIWLSSMRDRLEILRQLLRPDGVIFVSIDDNEYAYLTILMDEVFGRQNRCGQFIWEKKKKPSFLNANMGVVTEYVLAYSRDRRLSPAFIGGKTTEGKKYPINNAGNSIKKIEFQAGVVKFACADQVFKPQDMSSGNIVTRLLDPVRVVNGVNIQAFRLEGEWRYSQAKLDEIVEAGEEIRISKAPFRPNHIKPGGEDKKLKNLLSMSHYRMSTYEDATQESRALFGSSMAFDYPKPEKLIHTLLAAVTEPGDLVLDSFAGSGTTGAVAQKMGLRWIMVELGSHCHTHIIPRIKKVVDGEDPGGVTAETGWQGGGGFRYYRLVPPLLQKDEYGDWIINKDYNAAMLAEALCKIEGFKYDPSPEVYWQQGRSTDTDYIFVTTQTMTADTLQKVSDEVGPDRSLLVMCNAFCNKREWPNLTVKQIPKAVLSKCAWGQDNYSLEIKELPVVEDEPETVDGGPQVEPKAGGAAKNLRRKAAAVSAGNLFNGDETEGEGE